MEGNVLEAVKLMVVGMATVFLVLVLVIALGNLLVSFVNKYCPEEAPKQQGQSNNAPLSSVSVEVASVISAAIQQKFGGKAKVEKIEKI